MKIRSTITVLVGFGALLSGCSSVAQESKQSPTAQAPTEEKIKGDLYVRLAGAKIEVEGKETTIDKLRAMLAAVYATNKEHTVVVITTSGDPDIKTMTQIMDTGRQLGIRTFTVSSK